MNAQPQPQPALLKKSWISKHPYVVIGLILAGCLAPFLNKALHTDDALFVWTGEWIQKHPGDFFGFQVNWWISELPMWVANWNPPVFSYFLAGVAFLFGWNEMGLHLAGLAVSFAAAAGIYSLAKMWCERPLLATIIAVFTPAFLVSSTTLMCDVPMLALGIWALVFWERALAKRGRWWSFVLAGGSRGFGRADKIQRGDFVTFAAHLEHFADTQGGVVVAGAGGAAGHNNRLRVVDGQNVWRRFVHGGGTLCEDAPLFVSWWLESAGHRQPKLCWRQFVATDVLCPVFMAMAEVAYWRCGHLRCFAWNVTVWRELGTERKSGTDAQLEFSPASVDPDGGRYSLVIAHCVGSVAETGQNNHKTGSLDCGRACLRNGFELVD